MAVNNKKLMMGEGKRRRGMIVSCCLQADGSLRIGHISIYCSVITLHPGISILCVERLDLNINIFTRWKT